MRENTVRVNDVHFDLNVIAGYKSIDELKALNISVENPDESHQAVWDAAQEIKSKPPAPVKLSIVKPETNTEEVKAVAKNKNVR